MVCQVIIPESIEQRFVDIAGYIGQDNPIRAISFVKELRKRFEDQLSLMPMN